MTWCPRSAHEDAARTIPADTTVPRRRSPAPSARRPRGRRFDGGDQPRKYRSGNRHTPHLHSVVTRLAAWPSALRSSPKHNQHDPDDRQRRLIPGGARTRIAASPGAARFAGVRSPAFRRSPVLCGWSFPPGSRTANGQSPHDRRQKALSHPRLPAASTSRTLTDIMAVLASSTSSFASEVPMRG